MRFDILSILLLAAAPAAAQQGLAASESFVLRAQVTPSGGDRASSASFVAKLVLGEPVVGSASSATMDLVAGAAAISGGMGPVPPVVLAVSPPSGGKEGGGAPVTITGISLAPAGLPTADVTFDGSSSPLVNALTGTTLQAQVPSGESSLISFGGFPIEGNPKGPVDVGVSHALGADVRADAYTYLPALRQSSPAHIGQDLVLTMQGENPGSFSILATGVTVPGVGIPFVGFSGAIEVVIGLTALSGLEPTGAGDSVDHLLTLPDQPLLVGKTLHFQALAVHSLAPLQAEFTNATAVTVEP